jgi:hypothetical protein
MAHLLIFGQPAFYFSAYWMDTSHSRVKQMQNSTVESSAVNTRWLETTFQMIVWTYSALSPILIQIRGSLHQKFFRIIGSWPTLERRDLMMRSFSNSKQGCCSKFQQRKKLQFVFRETLRHPIKPSPIISIMNWTQILILPGIEWTGNWLRQHRLPVISLTSQKFKIWTMKPY